MRNRVHVSALCGALALLLVFAVARSEEDVCARGRVAEREAVSSTAYQRSEPVLAQPDDRTRELISIARLERPVRRHTVNTARSLLKWPKDRFRKPLCELRKRRVHRHDSNATRS